MWCICNRQFQYRGCKVETSYDETGQSVSNGSTTDLIGVGYNLGGGVMVETAYASIEEKDNGVIDTEVDLVMTKLSFGLIKKSKVFLFFIKNAPLNKVANNILATFFHLLCDNII